MFVLRSIGTSGERAGLGRRRTGYSRQAVEEDLMLLLIIAAALAVATTGLALAVFG